MYKRAKDRVEELVLMGPVFNLCAIASEMNCFGAINMQVYWIQVGFGREAAVTVPFVTFVWAFLEHVRDRRVMGYLLHIYVGTVDEVALESFTEDGVQRFIPLVTWLDEA